MAESSTQPAPALTFREQERKWRRGIDASSSDIDDVCEFIQVRVKQYELGKLQDTELWETFKEDFSSFTEDHFKQCGNQIILPLRNHLRRYGVAVPKIPHSSYARALYKIVKEEEPLKWTDDEIQDFLGAKSEFKSTKRSYILLHGDTNPYDRLRAINNIKPPTTPSTPVDSQPIITQPEPLYTQPPPIGTPPPPIDTTIVPHSITQPDNTRSLSNLAKWYTEENKYSGDSDNFEFKLNIFRDLCKRAGVPLEAQATAFPTMLRGLALNIYYSNLTLNQGMTFHSLCEKFRDYFEGAEYERNVLTKWNSISLKTVMQQNEGKSMEKCLDILLKDLRNLRHGLDKHLRKDVIIHNKTIIACRNIPACKFACYKPADNLAGLVSDLRSSIATFSKTENSQAYFTDQQHSQIDFNVQRYHRRRDRFE